MLRSPASDENDAPKAMIFDVQRFSIHDGPGIRTVVFFKGCGLRCAWCHNPEAVRRAPEMAYYQERCLSGCRDCVDVCPEDAIADRRESRVRFDRCTACGDCVDACPADALVRVGREIEAGDLLDEVARDRSFFDASDGGLTLSGGEPFLQATFLRRFLPLAKDARLHVAVETGGSCSFEVIESLLPHIDLILFDVKLMEAVAHERFTGSRNEKIHANLTRLVENQVPLVVRMPVVPAVNSGEENLAATARFLHRLGIREIQLLPYNHLWEAKLPRLAAGRAPLGIRPPLQGFYDGVCDLFARQGMAARL
ncbi:MAG TPA: glycyl-radical enzyme activating protein [Halothiobacillaceae bacterium]|nr:glycyl-radical enzyme activating protein [Halothiobacillaceae bacterium]